MIFSFYRIWMTIELRKIIQIWWLGFFYFCLSLMWSASSSSSPESLSLWKQSPKSAEPIAMLRKSYNSMTVMRLASILFIWLWKTMRRTSLSFGNNCWEEYKTTFLDLEIWFWGKEMWSLDRITGWRAITIGFSPTGRSPAKRSKPMCYTSGNGEFYLIRFLISNTDLK